MFDKFQIIAAPMAGITDWPFRRILRRCNPTLPIMTEMISCHSITACGKLPLGGGAATPPQGGG
ncbi:MAG: tRNA-dihydrouridine synthase, partial [Rickettsiales bacterium]|nr:tRNA-dihydrouridine synthase [Rickettsiales bacterium]